MKARVKNFTIEVQPMTKFDYNYQILKIQVQHTENKRVNGFYCNWNGYEFWLMEENFNKLYEIIEC
jgi:hypothetical protein